MRRILLLGSLVAMLAVAFTSVGADAAPLLTHTVDIDHNVDSGHHGFWAYESFDRTVNITKTGATTYDVLLTDHGTFTTIPGAQSPREGRTLPQVSGTFTGWYKLTVASATEPTAAHVASTYDYRCDPQGDCPGRPSSTSDWPKLYFGQAAVVVGGDYNWTYQTCSEKWVDASANNDGQDAAAGDITGRDCPAPTPTPSATPTTVPSGDHSPTPAPGSGTPGLPATGFASARS